MNEFTISKIDDGYVLHKNCGEFKLSWYDFWDIVKLGEKINAQEEIENYISDYEENEFLEMFGMAKNGVLNNENILNKIIEKLIKIRYNAESSDDVYDAIETICCLLVNKPLLKIELPWMNKEFVNFSETGKLNIERVLFADSEPIFFTSRNEKNDLYLCLYNGVHDNIKKWMIVEVSAKTVVDILKDKIYLREPFLDENKKRFSISLDKGGIYRIKTALEVPDEWDSKNSLFLPAERETWCAGKI